MRRTASASASIGWSRWRARLGLVVVSPVSENGAAIRLPIVAAICRAAMPMRVSQEGFGVLFDPATQRQLGLDRLPEDLLLAQVRAVDEGHCHQMRRNASFPSHALRSRATPTLARAIRLTCSGA